MYKIFITAVDPKGAILFEDYKLHYPSSDDLRNHILPLNEVIASKIEEVEKINEQEHSPF